MTLKSGPELERRRNAKQWKSTVRSMARRRYSKSKTQSKKGMRKRCKPSKPCKVLNPPTICSKHVYLRKDRWLSKEIERNLSLKLELRK